MFAIIILIIIVTLRSFLRIAAFQLVVVVSRMPSYESIIAGTGGEIDWKVGN